MHCGQLRVYSNQQPLTRVEYVLRPGQIVYLFISVLIISMETAIVLEEIHVNEITPFDSVSGQFTSARGRVKSRNARSFWSKVC